MPRNPPKPPRRKKPKSPPAPSAKPDHDLFARALANTVREGHGVDQAATFDMSEQLGAPRGYVGTRNIALERALGTTGVPLGRVIEISGWPGAGKSTVLDQIFAQCQHEGGIGALADTERGRNRAYMLQLGVLLPSMIWIGGKTAEAMFDEVETLARRSADMNCRAWVDALGRAGLKCPAPAVYKHVISDVKKDKKGNRKALAQFVFARWGREQAACLLEFQRAHGLPAFGIRDAASRAALRPCIAFGTPEQQKEGLAAWMAGDPHPWVQPADRPIVMGWDSVAGTATEAELEGDSRDVHPATAARVIRRNLRRLIQLIDDEAIAFVLINQRYAKIMQAGGRGGGSETYGGGGIKYHTTIRVEIDNIGKIFARSSDKDNGIPPMGQICRIRVPKNKVESPFHEEKFGLIFGRGADNAWAIYEDLKSRGIIYAGGGWSRFTDSSILGEARSWRGWQELANMMAEDRALWQRLRAIYHEGRV